MKLEAPDFFPLVAGAVFEFEVDRAGSREGLTVEVLSVEVSGGLTKAACRRTETRPGENRARDFEATSDGLWVRVDGEKELPCVPEAGMKGDAPPVSSRVSELGAVVSVPAGSFSGCLKVSYLVAAGDAGSGERFYAPGVGLVREDCAEESEPFESRLVRYSIPGPRGS